MTTPRSLTTTTTTTVPKISDTPARSLNRQNVLEEDEYTEALSHIIARDFFPSLVHLDATNDYLDSLDSRDPSRIEATVRRLEELSTPVAGSSRRVRAPLQTPSQTPYGLGPSDTPLRTPRFGTDDRGPPATKRARYDTDMSLDAFQARYTSEDNASFTQILDDENRARREKYGWAWEAQTRVEAQRARLLEARERAMIEPPPAPGMKERVLIEAPTPAGLITAAGEGKGEEDKLAGGDEGNGEAAEEQGKVVMLVPPQDEVVDVMAPKKDTRSAAVDGWNFKARNSLMFPPDADVAPHDLQPVSKDSGPPKIVKYANTRLPEQDDRPARSSSAPPSPTRSRIDAAIAGTPYRPKSPTVNSFSFVPALPSPTPSELGPSAVRQLMTTGTLLGTPRIISQDDDDAPATGGATPFRLSAPSAREALSHRLAARASKSLRDRANLLAGTTPRRTLRGEMGPPAIGTPRRAEAPGSLTPAAQRLLSRTTMGTAASRRAEAMGRAAGWEGAGSAAKGKDVSRVRWTPTPSPVTRRG